MVHMVLYSGHVFPQQTGVRGAIPMIRVVEILVSISLGAQYEVSHIDGESNGKDNGHELETVIILYI